MAWRQNLKVTVLQFWCRSFCYNILEFNFRYTWLCLWWYVPLGYLANSFAFITRNKMSMVNISAKIQYTFSWWKLRMCFKKLFDNAHPQTVWQQLCFNTDKVNNDLNQEPEKVSNCIIYTFFCFSTKHKIF